MHAYSVIQSCLALCNHKACQAPLFMEFSRQGYWHELPLPPPEDLPDPGIKPTSAAPGFTGRFFTTKPSGKPQTLYIPTNLTRQ